MCVFVAGRTHVAMAARPAGANPPALKIKLKPRREPLPVSTASQNQNPSSAQQQSIALQQQTNSTHQKSEEDSRAGGYKRKFPSPTSSPVSKRIFREDSPLSGESLEIFPALAGLPEVLPERFEQLSAEPLVIKHRLGHHHASIAALIQREQQGRVEDEDTRSSRLRSSAITLENISHGQLQVISVVPCSITGPRLAISSQDDMGQSDSVMRASIDAAVSQQIYPFASWTRPDPQPSKGHNVAIIPTHASWFAWDRIHKLERQAMPQFFYGKSKLQSAETFMQARNAIIMKCRLNPQTPISLLDIRGLSDLGDKELAQILEFLVQWGLVNYQAELNSETSGFKYPTKVPVYLIEDGSGLLSSSQLSLTPLEYLYQYEPLQAPGMALKNLAFDEETSSVVPENVVKEASGTVLSGTSENFCSACAGDCSQRHFYCEKQADYIVCPDCYGNGKLGIGMTTTDFVPFDGYPEASDVFDSGNWSDQETLMLLEALEIHGDNWTEVSEFVGTKSKAQCISHFIGLSIEDRFFEDMEVPRSFTTVRTRHTDLHQPLISQEEHSTNLIDLEAKVPVGSDKPGLIMNPKTLGELQGEPEVHAAFEGAANPVMSLVAFLAATVGPRVAAVAAHSALSSLAEEYQAIQVAADKRDQNMPANSTGPTDIGFEKTTNSDSATDKGGAREKSNPEAPHVPDGHQLYLSKDSMRKVTSAALATAAMKAKLLADQEEREVQRLAAIIVDNQLKKLSVKLKQLGDIDSVLEKEREQIERNRQRLSTDRIRFMSTHLGPTAPTPQMPIPGNPNPMNTRPTGPLSGSGVAPAVMPTGAVMPALHPSHMLRPGLYTIGSSGMAMPVSASMVKPPS